jgi:hypothetical protein
VTASAARCPEADEDGAPVSDVEAIVDRFEIEALRGEFTDAG